MTFAVCIFFSVALTPLVFNAPDGNRIQIANIRWSAAEMAKSENRIFDNETDAERKFKVTTFPPEFTNDFDQRNQGQTDITGSAPMPTSGTAGAINVDQSLAIEFPTAAYEPRKVTGAIKRRKATIAANHQLRNASNTWQANSEANINYNKPIELPPPNFTTSAY